MRLRHNRPIRNFTHPDHHIQSTLIYESVTMKSYGDFELVGGWRRGGGGLIRREIIYI